MFKIISKFKFQIVGAVGIFVFVLVSVFLWRFVNKTSAVVSVGEAAAEAEALPYASKLDGTRVATEAEAEPQVLAVMIDNHPDARPQFGLAQARVVYEVPAEGGITRFLAIFNKNQQLEKVGPVRSARPYYLDWTREYGNPPYLHVGGSPEALRLIKQFGMWDADQFFWDPYYWRSLTEHAPHNVFTSSTLWDKLFADYGNRHEVQSWDGWQFASTTLTDTATSTLKEITVPYSRDYKVTWKRDEESKRYGRFTDDKPHVDALGKQILADTILVQFVGVKILDEVGHREIGTVGSGKAQMVVRGEFIHGTWKKETATSRTRFYDESGKEAIFSPGQTWVQVVPGGVIVEIGTGN